MKIDLNCDMGESVGDCDMGNDAELMRHISSASIACGFHAGDPIVMRKTIELALDHGVSIGAHPSYPDLQGFGRREMNMSSKEVHDIVLDQISAIKGVCEDLGTRLYHVKPHGALYNKAARCSITAEAIVDAVASIDSNLIVFGLADGELTRSARKKGLKAAEEGFSDRRYEPDGSLTPRSDPHALISDPQEAARQTLKMAVGESIDTRDGQQIKIAADTICIHGDGKNALQIAVAIRSLLSESGIEVASISVNKIS
jgi:UPF0271 protein